MVVLNVIVCEIIKCKAVPIMEFGADKVEKDFELLTIVDLLEELKNEEDVRPVLNGKFFIKQALEESKML